MVVTLLGFLTGVLIGMTGTGGGTLLTPLLLLFTPYPALVVIGTDLVTGVATKLVGFAGHWKLGHIYWRLAGYIILGSLPGSVAGIVFIRLLKANLSSAHLEASLRAFVGLALLAAAVCLPYVRRRKKRERSARGVPSRGFSRQGFLMAGAAVGFLVAVTSVGSGSLTMVFMLAAAPLPIAELVGTDIMLGLATTVLAASLYLAMGHFSRTLFVELVVGSIPGVLVGSWYAHRIPERYLGWILSFLYLFLGARLLLVW